MRAGIRFFYAFCLRFKGFSAHERLPLVGKDYFAFFYAAKSLF